MTYDRFRRGRLPLPVALVRGFCIALGALCLIGLAVATPTPGQQQAPDPGQGDWSALESTQQTAAAPTPTQNSEPVAVGLTLRDRFSIYANSFRKPESLLGPLFGASVDQARNEPSEWGQGVDAFGVRFASGYGRMLVSRTIRFGVAAADREDPRIYPSGESGIWRRSKSAVVHVFISPTDHGSQMPAFSRFAGTYGAAFISNAWYPATQATPSRALARGSTALLAAVGWSVFREFWPDIKRRITP